MSRGLSKLGRGFTLIELLVVVMIIAILAAIAVPNFLEAQVRSKVSRAATDMRTVALGLESYYVDHNTFPEGNIMGIGGARPDIPDDPMVLERLSTPVAYLTDGLPRGAFRSKYRSNTLITGLPPLNTDVSSWFLVEQDGDYGRLYESYHYVATKPDAINPSGMARSIVDVPALRGKASSYIIYNAGPMLGYINLGGVIVQGTKAFSTDLIYDPTNGTTSFGNIFRAGGAAVVGNNLHGAIAATRK